MDTLVYIHKLLFFPKSLHHQVSCRDQYGFIDLCSTRLSANLMCGNICCKLPVGYMYSRINVYTLNLSSYVFYISLYTLLSDLFIVHVGRFHIR